MRAALLADEFGSQSDGAPRDVPALDFCFFESTEALSPCSTSCASSMSISSVRVTATSREMAQLFATRLEGQVSKIPSLAKLPELLIQALGWIAGGSQR
jgi:hypothetical protein